MSWFLRNSEVASEDDGTERRPPAFRAARPLGLTNLTRHIVRPTRRVESYREVDEDLSQRFLSRRRTKRVTGAVHDDVPDALAHVAPAEGRLPLDPKVFEPGVAATEHEKAGNASRGDGVQITSESVQQASSDGAP